MTDWKKAIVSPTHSILEAIQIISNGLLQIGLVVDSDSRLVGTITDGDIRRAILNNIPLESPVEKIMFKSPTFVGREASRSQIIEIMKRKKLRHIPVLSQQGRIVDLKVLDYFVAPETRKNWVLLMAGGLGTRLRPLTEECPKPMLKVGGKPLLQTIVENLRDQGFGHFWISTHYKGRMIEDYFGDGARFGTQIQYIREEHQLGTAGALSLLPEKPTRPVFVMNGDVLTNVDFNRLLDFHVDSRSVGTMCVRQYDFQVPFGVVGIRDQKISSIEEKPVHSFFVNAGIYVLDPLAVEMVPSGEEFDMTHLFDKLVHEGFTPLAFPIHEYWLDIGRRPDFDQAEGDYVQNFSEDTHSH